MALRDPAYSQVPEGIAGQAPVIAGGLASNAATIYVK
jgi:hypothetical protein